MPSSPHTLRLDDALWAALGKLGERADRSRTYLIELACREMLVAQAGPAILPDVEGGSVAYEQASPDDLRVPDPISVDLGTGETVEAPGAPLDALGQPDMSTVSRGKPVVATPRRVSPRQSGTDIMAARQARLNERKGKT